MDLKRALDGESSCERISEDSLPIEGINGYVEEVQRTLLMLRTYTRLTFWDIHQDTVERRAAGTRESFKTTKEVQEWLETHGSLLWTTGGRE